MELRKRWQIEKKHHNREARAWFSRVDRSKLIQAKDCRLLFGCPPEIKDMFMAWMGNVYDKRILELGCGRGDLAILLAKKGGNVSAIDISEEYIQIVRRRAVLNGVQTRLSCECMPGERLTYEDEAFDLVYGSWVLHHLDLSLVWLEIYRVLRSGGRGVFVEPFGEDIILEWLKSLLPISRIRMGLDTPTEKSLRYKDIWNAQKIFQRVTVHPFGLLSRLDRLIRSPQFRTVLNVVDVKLLTYCKWLRRYAVAVVILVEK